MLVFILNDIKFTNWNLIFMFKTYRFCHHVGNVVMDVIIQLMHSFEVNINQDSSTQE